MAGDVLPSINEDPNLDQTLHLNDGFALITEVVRGATVEQLKLACQAAFSDRRKEV